MASSFIQSFIKHVLQVFHRPHHPAWCREFHDSQSPPWSSQPNGGDGNKAVNIAVTVTLNRAGGFVCAESCWPSTEARPHRKQGPGRRPGQRRRKWGEDQSPHHIPPPSFGVPCLHVTDRHPADTAEPRRHPMLPRGQDWVA